MLQFGNTADSQILALGKATARSWGVNRVTDTKGNYYTVTYINDTTNGQAYPSQINYTANDGAGLASYNSVRFVYATRPDITPIYHAGSLIQTTVRLTDVQTYAGSTFVADYRLAYQQGSATGRSQLASVTLCDGSGNCLPATTFTWQNGTTTPVVNNNVGGQNGISLPPARPYLADFNGDGMTDIMWDKSRTTSGDCTAGIQALWTSNGGANFSANNNFNSQYEGAISGYPLSRSSRISIAMGAPMSGGMQARYKQECPLPSMLMGRGPITTWLSTGAAAHIRPSQRPQTCHSLTTRMLTSCWRQTGGNINGDGRADLYWIQQTVVVPGCPIYDVAADGSGPNGRRVDRGQRRPVNVCSKGCPETVRSSAFLRADAADFNGDGFTDLVWNSTQGCVPLIWMGKGDGTFVQTAVGTPSPNGATGNAYIADFNGDGQSDFLWDNVDGFGRSAGGSRELWLSAGDGTFIMNTNPGGLNGNLAGYSPIVADFNGDGIADILWTSSDTLGRSTGAACILWLGKGDGTFTIISNFMTVPLVGYVPYVGDFNGDGKADVLWDSRSVGDSRSTGTRVMWMSDGVPPDLLTLVTNGLGATVAVTYQPLTNSTALH